ncbi:septum formation initiator family protein [Paenibacillus sp. IB182496]|uniref:Septum formation initiator family protein n=1 Tax=Paenibacillus sabuli TaxID=2772509 RepID=A0A927BRX1_9BACL|nr:septum formation initiator family protein [Paenibacillus sabuli]MBD2844404.1 septum formation initiator family protein [Paenibacillus sabuli]
MAYMHGNLALQPKKEPQHAPKPKKRVIVKRKTMPVQEKLLYLFTIAVCVIVAGTIIFRYASIYQMNVNIQDLNRQQNALSIEVQELKKKVEQLSDPQVLRGKAIEQGMVQSDPDASIQIMMDGAAVLNE